MNRKPLGYDPTDVDEFRFFVLAFGEIPGGVKLTSGTLAARITAGSVHLVEASRDHRQRLEECFYKREAFFIED
jgi:hypothetical protein